MTREEAIKILKAIRVYECYPKSASEETKEAIDMAIEALKERNLNDSLVRDSSDACKESESKLDLISRQEVLDSLEESGYCYHFWIDIENVVNSLPSAESKTGEWIPVSEKPKDEERTYLVQLDSGGMRSCRWTNANPIWTELTTDWHWNIFDIPQYCKVVAWMDLEPYKGGDSE